MAGILATCILPAVLFISSGSAQDFIQLAPLPSGPDRLAPASSAQPLPFEEDWSTGSFAFNQWEFSPGQGNWQISMVQKSASPAADFAGNPMLTNYSFSLVSRPIDATSWSCAHLWLDFDHKLANNNSTGNEKLFVELFVNNAWDTVLILSNSDAAGWTNHHLLMNKALNKEFRVRFRASGTNSADILHWYVDNIRIYGICKPPSNLEWWSSSSTISLTWLSPCIPATQLVKLFQWAGTPDNAYYQNYTKAYGVVYDLSAYPEAMLNKIDFHQSSWGTNGIWHYKIHVVDWTTFTEIATLGPKSTTGDDKWENNVPLGDIPGVGGKLIGIMLEPLSNSPTDAYPCFSADNVGPDGFSVTGTLPDYTAFSSSTIGDFLQNLWIKIPADDKMEILKPLKVKVGKQSSAQDSNIVVGYNVYRTENYINPPYILVTPTPLTVTSFSETMPATWLGWSRYFVKAVFQNLENETTLCESTSDTILAFYVGQEELTSDIIRVYPNPASGIVTISSGSMLRDIEIVYMFGETVQSCNKTNDSVIRADVSALDPGVYFIRVVGLNATRTVKFIVTR